ncbi:hypothetical protein BDF14DRAFT_1818331 [Spinellus fusiger]|nr:hypothetical protein BDF14DRAFT_1818331 [Spinellus fusiger]
MENTAAAATATTTYIAHWSHKQKVAIALICRTTLMKVESIVHPPWCRQWWVQLLNYLDLTLLEIDSSQINPRAAVDVLSKDKDIRIEVLVDLLALTLGLSSQEKHKDIAYDARARRFFFTLNYQLGLDVVDMVAVERNVAQQIFFCIQQDLQKNPDRTTDMKALAQKSIEDSHSKKKAMRWLTTGASIVGGGAIIALTGGLAAPLVAPLVAGITGATFFATAGGVALITSLFGLTGGGLAGWKMHRRTRGVKEFEFTQILKDSDLPDIPALNCTICISGYLANSKDEVQSPWIDAFSQKRSQSDVYCLAYETEELLALGHSFQRFVTNQAVRYAGVEVAKQTVLRAFFAAMALPATLLTLADVIDNPWQIATDRSRKAGIVLADVLQERVQGNRPCSLVSQLLFFLNNLLIGGCLCGGF